MKSWLTVVILSLFIVPLWADSSTNDILFDLDLRQLSDMSIEEVNEIIELNQWLIMDGLLSSINHEEDVIYIEVVNGRWNGTESIDVYRAEFELNWDQWISVFPERSRSTDDGVITVNSYLLILAKLIDSYESDEATVFRFIAYDIRKVD